VRDRSRGEPPIDHACSLADAAAGLLAELGAVELRETLLRIGPTAMLLARPSQRVELFFATYPVLPGRTIERPFLVLTDDGPATS